MLFSAVLFISFYRKLFLIKYILKDSFFGSIIYFGALK